MPIPSYPEFFNDVFGPIMQPGSSSHTAGPCRIGYLARSLLGEELRAIHVLLDANGSFAGTFGIMAEDRAMVAGALGFLPDDERLFDAFALADQAGIACRFEFGALTESQHPNAVKFTLTGASGRSVTLVADSSGGGMIETRVVDGYPLWTQGDAHVLLVFDPNPVPTLPIAAFVNAVSGLPGLVEVGASSSAVTGSKLKVEGSDPQLSTFDLQPPTSNHSGDPALGQVSRAARPGRDPAEVAWVPGGCA